MHGRETDFVSGGPQPKAGITGLNWRTSNETGHDTINQLPGSYGFASSNQIVFGRPKRDQLQEGLVFIDGV